MAGSVYYSAYALISERAYEKATARLLPPLVDRPRTAIALKDSGDIEGENPGFARRHL